MALTSIIVPTVFNGRAIERVTKLVKAHTDEPHELIVIDTTPDALGYVTTANRGLAQAEGDILVVLNDDCQPQPNWLCPLISAIESGVWLCSPLWKYARLGGHCLAFPRACYEATGGFDTRYRHWCADHHLELTVADMGKPMRQVRESNVVHDPNDPLRLHYRRSQGLPGSEDLPNTGEWYLEDQAVYESIWGERHIQDGWPEDWSDVA
jgi:glycosyltransferase involved in cell wall biosynthesis